MKCMDRKQFNKAGCNYVTKNILTEEYMYLECNNIFDY